MNTLQIGWPKCGLAIVCDDVAAIGHSENVRSQPAARWTGQRHLGRDVDVLVMHPAFFEQQQLRLVGENPFQVGLGKPDIGERLCFVAEHLAISIVRSDHLDHCINSLKPYDCRTWSK
jgi:hypothetical protein